MHTLLILYSSFMLYLFSFLYVLVTLEQCHYQKHKKLANDTVLSARLLC